MNDLRFAFRQLLKNPGFTAVAVLLSFWVLAAAGAETSFSVRSLSLKDCIQTALEHNLDVKIERFTPEIARHELNLAYAHYDPVFGGSAIHRYGFEHARKDSTNRIGTRTNRDEFSGGVIGVLPTGLSYELGGDVSNTRTTDFAGRAEDSVGAASIHLRQPLLRNSWIDARG
jgi:outer membrane protein TolC